ncbi:receptor-type tyrosine-protein phosphatase kappa-like [Diadema antillarum]|uniref:receptor-type tyrosine-protein phosphatase kappa-like n=1 Tax=Diadema antillarum TaxID=105358 RepID=UPI003A880B89
MDSHHARLNAAETSGSISVKAFPAFLAKKRDTSFFSDEFDTLPETDIFPHEVASKPANFAKNRYRNILPYDSSRVQLDFINGDPHSDYYNASYISSFDRDRAYIASQGPNTASLDDFWRMVWQKRVRVIVMLTNLEEGMRVKCLQYWPEETNECIAYGAIDVTLLSAQKITDWVKRTMVLKKGPNSRRVCQYHYRAWPDKDVPKHSASLLKFLRQVRAEYDGGGGSPLLVHCSAGVGRTGVVIAIDSVVAHARRSERVEVYKFVKYMRHRRPFMVQTPEQYQFVYNTVLEDLLWEETEIPGKNFSLQLARLKRNVRGRMHSRLNQEFQKLKTLCPDPPECSMRSGKMAENRSKNRYGNTLPLQRNRVILQTRDSPEADYINASFVRARQGSFITTQMPMPNTVCDFWTMVADYKPAYIIMLNENYGTDKSDVQYWPDSGYRRYGPYTISASVIKQDVDIIVRCLTVESSWGKQSRCEISSPRILGFERAKSRDVRSRHLLCTWLLLFSFTMPTEASTSTTTRQSAAIATQVMADLVKNEEFIHLLESIVGNAIEKKLNELLEQVQGEVFDLKRDLEEKDREVKRLGEKVLHQEQNISRLEHTVDSLEQYSRRSCLRIFGLEEKKGENTDTLVTEVIQSKLGVSLDPVKDIDRSHRTGGTHESASQSSRSSSQKARPRPIIVKLNSYRKRKEIITNRRKLKGSGIVIAEDLTKRNQRLLSLARASKNITAAWSSDGRIIALISASGGKTATKLITCEEDIKKLH